MSWSDVWPGSSLLDLCHVGSWSYATLQLGHLGADGVKIDGPEQRPPSPGRSRWTARTSRVRRVAGAAAGLILVVGVLGANLLRIQGSARALKLASPDRRRHRPHG
jgi:hypothetical protein